MRHLLATIGACMKVARAIDGIASILDLVARDLGYAALVLRLVSQLVSQ